jgi:anti-sigma factor RsiW
MSCPDLLLLSQLLDGELAPADMASIRPHVDGCAACGSRLERLERATAAARVSMKAEPEPTGPPGPGCLTPDRLAGWAARTASVDELGAAESHLGGCDACLAEALGMVRMMAKLDAGPTLPVPDVLRARVASRWAAAPVEESLTALVIRVARAGMALLERHVVAPVIDVQELPLAVAAVRALESAASLGFRIRAPEAEIRGTIVAEDGTVGLTLTLLGKAEEALGGQRVFLRRHGRSIYSARTDAAGSLVMPRVEPGVYEVSCPGIGTSFRLDLRP